MTKMVVQNLSPQTTAESVNKLFAEFGTVQSVRLATDVMTGRCGGFGFVNVYEQKDGAAVGALDGTCLDGRVLRVTFEKKREAPYCS
jgi:RNA recognition motif-containing protein